MLAAPKFDAITAKTIRINKLTNKHFSIVLAVERTIKSFLAKHPEDNTLKRNPKPKLFIYEKTKDRRRSHLHCKIQQTCYSYLIQFIVVAE